MSGVFFSLPCLRAPQLTIYAMKSPGSSGGESVQRADWQAALNCLTFCSSVKRRLPIIAPVRQRQSNTRLDDSGYAEHGWKDDESEEEGVLWMSEAISTAEWDSFLKLAWKWAIGWKHVIDCFRWCLKNCLKKRGAGVQCPRTQEMWYFPPSIFCQRLSCCGKVCEWCVCVAISSSF